MRHKLIEKASGKEVKPGMRIVDVLHQQLYELVSFKVKAPPSTGQVIVVNCDTKHEGAYYPSVFGLEIREIPE